MDRYRKSMEQLDNHLKQIHEKHVIVLGNDDSGKRTLMKKLCKDQRPIESIVPIVGFDLRVAQNEDKLFTSWKVGGCSRLEPIWKKCFEYPPEVLIFVVNSADRDSIDDTLIEFKLFEKYLTKNVVVAIAANKQDIENAMTAEFIRDKFRTECKHILVQCKNWRVFPTCFNTGIGLSKIIDWIETESRKDIKLGSDDHLENVKMVCEEKTVAPNFDSRPSDLLLYHKLSKTCDSPENQEEFMNLFVAGEVFAFDHRAHLRVLYVITDKCYSQSTKFKEVVNQSISSYQNFFSKTILDLKYNQSMTIFWCHITAVYFVKNRPYQSFEDFLKKNIDIMWGKQWAEHYSKDVIFSADARTKFVKPNLKEFENLTWFDESISSNYYCD